MNFLLHQHQLVDLFGNAISNNEKEKDGESSSSSSLSGGSATSPHKGGKSRHRIPITDEFADDNHPSDVFPKFETKVS